MIQRSKRSKRRKRIRLKRVLMLLSSLIIVSASTIAIKDFIASKNELNKGKQTYVEAKASISDVKIEKADNKDVENNTEAPVKEDVKKPKETVNKDDKDTSTQKDTNTNSASKKKPVNYKSTFSNSVFLGDSITEALSFYDIISDSRVIASKGSTASKAMRELDSVIKLKPKNIFILFGMNDILTTGDSGKFIKNYTQLIHVLKDKLPDSNIYVQSILPVEDSVAKKKPRLTNSAINEFNRALIDMVKAENVNYLNIASVLKDAKGNLHESDGIHYKYQFYSLWLEYLKNQIN